MKKTFALLALSTALTTTLTSASALPAWSAMRPVAESTITQPFMTEFVANQDGVQNALPRIFLSEYESEDDDNDDDNNRSSGEDDDDECEGGCSGSARNPAPVGTVTPPKNGLFGTGAPKVQLN